LEVRISHGLSLSDIQECAGLSLGLNYLCLSPSLSLVNGYIFGDAGLLNLGILFNFVFISLSLS